MYIRALPPLLCVRACVVFTHTRRCLKRDQHRLFYCRYWFYCPAWYFGPGRETGIIESGLDRSYRHIVSNLLVHLGKRYVELLRFVDNSNFWGCLLFKPEVGVIVRKLVDRLQNLGFVGTEVFRYLLRLCSEIFKLFVDVLARWVIDGDLVDVCFGFIEVRWPHYRHT